MILPIVLFLLLLIAPDVYLWTEYIRQQDSWWLNVLWFMPLVAAVASFILVNRGVYHNTFIRVMFALVLCFGLPKLVFALLQFFVSWQLALVLPIAIQIALIYGFFFGWRRIVVRSSTCVSKLLPKSFDGYKVLQFSDASSGNIQAQSCLYQETGARHQRAASRFDSVYGRLGEHSCRGGAPLHVRPSADNRSRWCL